VSGPHEPLVTVAGHFLSMQPSDKDIRKEPTKVWYRGDQYVELYNLMYKYRRALEMILDLQSAADAVTPDITDSWVIAEEALK
jgi:hypothetical protein